MIKQLFSLSNKVCLVTGGSRGIGHYIARGFLSAGAKRVYITAHKEQACQQAAGALNTKFDDECIALPGNNKQHGRNRLVGK